VHGENSIGSDARWKITSHPPASKAKNKKEKEHAALGGEAARGNLPTPILYMYKQTGVLANRASPRKGQGEGDPAKSQTLTTQKNKKKLTERNQTHPVFTLFAHGQLRMGEIGAAPLCAQSGMVGGANRTTLLVPDKGLGIGTTHNSEGRFRKKRSSFGGGGHSLGHTTDQRKTDCSKTASIGLGPEASLALPHPSQNR